MAVDIEVNENFRTEWNANGDLGIVEGDAQIANSLSISIAEYANLSVPTLTDTAIEERRGDIEGVIRNNPFTEPPYEVTVEDIDYENAVVTFAASTKRVTLPVNAGQP